MKDEEEGKGEVKEGMMKPPPGNTRHLYIKGAANPSQKHLRQPLYLHF